MKTLQPIFIAATILIAQCTSINAQTIAECSTPPPTFDPLDQIDSTIQAQAKTAITLKMTVRIFVHIIRQSNGTGGLTTQQVENAMSIMENHYQNNIDFDRIICFFRVGQDEIHNDNFYNFTGAQFNSLVQTNSHSDAIDIYLLGTNVSTGSFGGQASGIPGGAFVINGNLAETGVISHEMGHCLGLYHTHETSFGQECADGSNCNYAGDRICDTPADPGLSGKVNADCIIFTSLGLDPCNNDNYSPDPGSIMSYSQPQCLHDFTHGQGTRMYIVTTNQNASVLVPEDLIVPTTTITSGDHIYAALKTITVGSPNTFDQTGGYVEFVAGEQIVWGPGTHITNGHAYIQPFACGGQCKMANNNGQNNTPQNDIAKNTTNEKFVNTQIQNYPNPFKNHTHIDYYIDKAGQIDVSVYNTLGEKISSIETGNKEKGQHTATLDARKLSAGTYICIVKQDGIIIGTVKMQLTK